MLDAPLKFPIQDTTLDLRWKFFDWGNFSSKDIVIADGYVSDAYYIQICNAKKVFLWESNQRNNSLLP